MILCSNLFIPSLDYQILALKEKRDYAGDSSFIAMKCRIKAYNIRSKFIRKKL